MKVCHTTTYKLDADDYPCVVALPDRVSLHYPGWSDMPDGFSIDFLPTHLPILRELCAALAQLDAPELLTIDLDAPLTGLDLARAIEDELTRLGWCTTAFVLPPPDTAYLYAFPTTEPGVIRIEDDGEGCCVHGTACLVALRALQAPISYDALWDVAITPYYCAG